MFKPSNSYQVLAALYCKKFDPKIQTFYDYYWKYKYYFKLNFLTPVKYTQI